MGPETLCFRVGCTCMFGWIATGILRPVYRQLLVCMHMGHGDSSSKVENPADAQCNAALGLAINCTL